MEVSSLDRAQAVCECIRLYVNVHAWPSGDGEGPVDLGLTGATALIAGGSRGSDSLPPVCSRRRGAMSC